MEFISLAIPDVVLVKHRQYAADERGSFMELFRQQEFAVHCYENGGDVGSNFLFSLPGQSESFPAKGRCAACIIKSSGRRGKLVQVISGTIFDVAVDLRPGSASHGQWVGQHLDADEPMSPLDPPGFAHGFYVPSEESTVLYKCTDYYCPEYERTSNWADPSWLLLGR